MSAKTEENIKDLVKHLIAAADVAGELAEDQTLSKQKQRQFDFLFDRLRKEWISIAEEKMWFGIFGPSKEDKYEIQN